MVELDEKAERGVQVITEMMGETFGRAFRDSAMSDNFASEITRMAASFSFADSWGHPGLQRKQKSLVILGLLIADNAPKEFKNHVKIGIANGLTVVEIEGVLVQACSYVGWTRIATATSAAIEALRELGLEPNLRTSEERGLL